MASKTATADKDSGPAPKSPRKRRQYMPAAERREQILTSAREVFARNGLKGSRTRELAQAAGINQATLFEHFKSKEELFTAAVVQPLIATLEGARERVQSYADASSSEDLIPLLQKGMEQHLESMTELYPLLVQGLFSDQEMGKKLYRNHIAPLLEARADIMADFIQRDLDSNLVQLASFGMFFAVAMDQAMTGQSRDLPEVARQLTRLITLDLRPVNRDK